MTGSRSDRSVSIGLYHPRAVTGDGGITRSVRAISTELSKAGYEVRVIFNDEGVQPPFDNWTGVQHTLPGPISVPNGFSQAVAHLDVVVLHSAWVMHNVVAGCILRQLGIPYILAPRGAYDPMIVKRNRFLKSIWWRAFEHRLVRGAAGIHILFEAERKQLRDMGFEGSLLMAPNGVQVPPDATWDGGSGGSLLYIGRFDPEHKGLDALLAALKLIPEKERPHISLRGPDWRRGKAKLEELRAQLDLERWVDIQPGVYGSEKWRLMESARAFLYPSRWEAFGNSAAEAASIGVPVLTGKYPLGKYLARRNAAIAAAPDPASLAQGILRVMAPEAAELGANAQTVMRSFSWPSVAASWGEQLTRLASSATD